MSIKAGQDLSGLRFIQFNINWFGKVNTMSAKNEQLNPIFRDFLQSYFEKDAKVSDQDWLKRKLQENGLELTEEELEQYSAALIGSVQSFTDSLNSLEKCRAEGLSAEEWLQKKIDESGCELTPEEMKQASEAYAQANQRLQRNLKAEEVGQNANSSMTDIVAEQQIIDDFNILAWADGAQYEAVIDQPTEDSVYGNNLFDIAIVDKQTGEKLESYQVIYGNTIQETIDLVNETTTAGQTIIVPANMVEEVRKACLFKEISDHIGGTGQVPTEGEPFRLEEAQTLLKRKLPEMAEQFMVNPREFIKDFAQNAFSSGVLSAGLLQGVKKIADNEEVEDDDVKKLIEEALLSKDNNGLKTAVAGAIAAAAHKKLIDVLPSYTPPAVAANIASIGLENIKVFAQVEQGTITAEDGIEKIGNTSMVMGFELFWNHYAPKGVAVLLRAIPLVGPYIASEAVAKEILSFVEPPVKAIVVEGAKKIAPVAKDLAVGLFNTSKNAFNLIKETLFA